MNLPFASRTNSLYLRALALSSTLATACLFGINPQPKSPPAYNPASPDCTACGSGKGGPEGNCPGSFRYSFNLGQTRLSQRPDFLDASRAGIKETHGGQSGYRAFDQLRTLSFSTAPHATQSDRIIISQSRINSALYDPFVIRFYPHPKASYVSEKGTLRQVLTDDSLTMVEPVVELNATDANSTIPVGFRIKLWPRSALSTTRKVNGAYPLPEVEPQAVEYFRNPDHPAQNNRLLLTSSDLSDPTNPLHTTTLYDQSAPEVLIVTTLRGDDLDGTLLRRQTLSYLSRGPHANDRIFERSVEEASLLASGALGPLQIVSTVREQYADFDPTPKPYSAPDGQKPARQDWNNDQRLLQRIIDPDTDHKQVTTWEYFQDANNSNIHGRLKSVRRPDGSWERWEYADQGQAVVIEKRYSSWKDVAFGNYQQGRLQETIINASEFTRTTLVEGTVISLVVSRTETDPEGMLLHTEDRQVDGQSHLSVSAFHPANAGGLLAQRPAYRISLDGTLTTWEYKQLGGGGLRITTRTGLGELPAFAHGTKIISTYDVRQNLLSVETRDLATDRPLGKRVGSDFDTLGIPSKWTLDNDPTRYSLTIPGPHGPTFERSPDGSIATYSYDALGRVSQIDRQSSANGPVLSTLRTQDANVTTSHLTDGATTLLQSSVTTQFGTGGNCCGGSGSSSHLTTRSPDADGDGQPELSTRLVLLDQTAGRIVISTAPDGSTRNSAHYLDGQLKSLFGTAQPDQSFDYGVHQENGGGLWTRVYQNNLTQWTTTYRDALGRPFRTTRADGSSLTRTYYSSDAPAGSRGRLHIVTDPDGTTLTHSYDAKGQATASTPLPGNRTILTRTDSDVVEHPQLGTALRTRSYRNEQLLSTTWTTPDGTQSVTDTLGNVSTQTSPHPQDGAGTQTQVSPNGVISHALYEDGRLLAQLILQPGSALPDTFTGFANLPGLVSGTSYAYDSFGRILSTTDSRTGTTTIGSYLQNGTPTQTTDPGGRVTTLGYDVMGRQVRIDLPDTLDTNGTILPNLTHSSHYQTGQLKATWGGQATPTRRLYDEQGRLTELRTYPELASGIEPTEATGHQSTRWIYDNVTGNLLQKLDHQGNGPTYGYTPGGKLETRQRARETITTYAYQAGLLSSVLHGDQGETPGLAYAYDDLGRVSTVTQGDNQWTYAYDPVHHGLTTETITYANGFTRQINHSYDALHRHSTYSLRHGQLTENTASYQRDALGRLSTLASGNDGFQYDYLDQAPYLVEQVSGPAHQVQNAYDATRDLLLEKHNLNLANQSVSRFSYSVNALGQRTSLVTSGSAFRNTSGQTQWGYDELGQLVRADHNTSDQNDRAYQYDKLGNRIHATDDQGTTQYQTNELNQYLSAGGTNYQYDDDGNLISDGLRTYRWNANNRLIEVKLGAVSLATYAYDHQGRRISKSTPQGTTQFVYDGWNLLAEYSETEGAPISLKNSYLWGPDLSGSFQGAGGVGGLLSVSDENGTTFYATYDGNGNLSEYLDKDGGSVAHYEYDPFGRTVTQSGDRAQSFSFRFSTKYQDTETGFYYYGYRYYDTTTGRWLSRDPIQEQGGLNLYGFVGNDGVNGWDLLGMDPCEELGKLSKYSPPSNWMWEDLPSTAEEYNSLSWSAKREMRCMGCHGMSKVERLKVGYPWQQPWFNREGYIKKQKILFGTMAVGATAVGAVYYGPAILASTSYAGTSSYVALGTNPALLYTGAEVLTTGFEIGVKYDGPPLIPGFGDPVRIAAVNWLKQAPASDVAKRIATKKVKTRHGVSSQANTPAARSALAEVQSGGTVYRQGSFDVQRTGDAQFWSLQNPASMQNFSNKMGMPGGVSKLDWIMGGTVSPGTPVITRPAPGIGSNVGGNMEVVVPSNGVQNLWFHMPD